jgi:hypothetical protein
MKGRGESACMALQGTAGRPPASHPLVVVELDMTVDPHNSEMADWVRVEMRDREKA